MGILHFPESALDMGLRSSAKNDFFGGPVVIISAENPLPEPCANKPVEGECVGMEAEVETIVLLEDFNFEDFADVLPGGALGEVFVERGCGVSLPASLW